MNKADAPSAANAGAFKSIFTGGRDAVKRRFWNAKPFPHVYFDDFLPADRFEKLVATVRNLGQKADFSFATDLEKNKTTFSSEALSAECQSLVASLTGSEFIAELSELTGIKEITPLTAYKDSVYRFYHKMDAGGFLGSHVDHSDVIGDRVHFLNCIFYGPEKWDPSWGGDTVLFDKWGFKEVAKVPCKPNRLLIFLHTSQSFHGVSRLAGNPNHRFTVYMDYYASLKDLPALDAQSQASGSSFKSKFWKHKTIFVPLTLKHCHKYIRGYFRYLRKQPY